MKSSYNNKQTSREREIERRLELERYRTLIVCESLCLLAMNQEFGWRKKGLTRLWSAMVRLAGEMRVHGQPCKEDKELGENIWNETVFSLLLRNTDFDFAAKLREIGVDINALEDSVLDYNRKTGEIIFKKEE